jgi:predicted AAA+ superfamily ATPase
MALTNHERVGKMLGLLTDGLASYAERELKAFYRNNWFQEVKLALSDNKLQIAGTPTAPEWDAAGLFAVILKTWDDVFRRTLGNSDRSMVFELRDTRNKWAHQKPFSTDDAYRALDTAQRLLLAVSSPQAEEIDKLKNELLRVRFDEQVRTEKRKAGGTIIEGQTIAGMKPWRDVVAPHKDVASGRYQQAEFAADLWQVHLGEGSDEYRNPAEFFRRTYLTESLKGLLIGAINRLAKNHGDPVVQLQTNFGGGKTHSMLALYHLFSGTPTKDLLGLEEVMKNTGVSSLPKVKRVVLVGNKISPGNPSKKPDGTVVRTLWGELAWQLGGKKAFERIRADDEKATSPGDSLRELFNDCGPALILIDEWVAYARQLHDQGDLPGGPFETHFTFAQALTESAKLAKHCLLVISLPASDTSGSPHTQADDVEVGGERGRAALDRLRNAVGRVEASWRPASADEGFEIVRRRLFEPLITKDQFVARDAVAKEFANLYRTQHQEFPPECRDSIYEQRLKAAYPIHPELFDRLYSDWSTLVKFQRTRGVLRLMASVIHSLWENGDRNPLILPCNIAIDEPRVQFELTRYLSDNWVPVLEKDVDGPNSLPRRIDGEVPNLGRVAACRRIARTIYLGSAPTVTAANRGIKDRRVKLGCVMPGESPAVFGDALRRMSTAATYLYADAARYWYSTQPTVTKLAEDRAEQLKSDPDKVVAEIEKRLRDDLKKVGDFSRVHPMPATGQDVPDDLDARLVVLGVDHPYSKEPGNAAEVEAKAILSSRGNTPRLYQNSLAFLAVDKIRLQDLDEAVRRFIAWETILDDAGVLNLTDHQKRQANSQKESTDSVVKARLPEAYQWLLVPVQNSAADPVKWEASRLNGQDQLAVRASKKLKSDELLFAGLSSSRLKMELDRVPLWRGQHVPIKQLVEDFARYLYLPRLRSTAVLLEAIREGLRLLTWDKDSFAYADGFDDKAGRYRGLRCGQMVNVTENDLTGLLVHPAPAKTQNDLETKSSEPGTAVPGSPGPGPKPTDLTPGAGNRPESAPKLTRFYGTVSLDPARAGRDASRITDEVIAHLSGLVGSEVKITLEIEASIPQGAPDNVVRTVTENSRTLKFTTQGFEQA